MAIPVLEENVTSFDTFADNLVKWANGWVNDVALPICRASRELYENKAIVMLLDEWRSYTDRYEEDRIKNLHSIATTGEPWFLYDDEDSWDKDHAHEISQVLYRLLISH